MKVSETACRKQAGRHTESIWFGKIMNFVTALIVLYFIASPESDRKERQTVGMYANTVQKTQKLYFLKLLMFPKKAMAKERYGIKQEF